MIQTAKPEMRRLPTVQECMEELDRDIWLARTRPDDYSEQTLIILEAQRHYLHRMSELEKALEEIARYSPDHYGGVYTSIARAALKGEPRQEPAQARKQAGQKA